MSERSDNATIHFVGEYSFDGSTWGFDIWASTWEEAEMKMRAMGRGKILGVHGGTVIPDGEKCPTCGRIAKGDLPC